MRISIDPTHLDGLHDFLVRCEWTIDRDGDDLLALAHPTVGAGERPAQLAMFLAVWAAMHPTAPRPRLVLE